MSRAAHLADTWGIVIVSCLLMLSMFTAAVKVGEVVHARDQQAAHLRQLALVKTQREVRGLVQTVTEQRTVILASRHVGLLQLDPGPWQEFTATWYSEGGINGNGVTALGKRTTSQWTCAVDPQVIPLGSVVEVQFGNGTQEIYQATDTGSAIVGNRIDIFDPSEADSLQHGVQNVMVRILVKGR